MAFPIEIIPQVVTKIGEGFNHNFLQKSPPNVSLKGVVETCAIPCVDWGNDPKMGTTPDLDKFWPSLLLF